MRPSPSGRGPTTPTSSEDLGYDIAGQATSGEELLAAAGTVHPDVVLLDVNLAGPLDGIQTGNRRARA